MVKVLFTRLSLMAALAAMAACTVHQTETSSLSGPSEFALSLTLTASPDSIVQDGSSQSRVQVAARDANGKPASGVPLRMDMFVNGQTADFGTLSARTVVTGSDGLATVVFTAPPPLPAGSNTPSCAGGPANVGVPGPCVEIAATPSGSNFATSSTRTVLIHLMPLGVILPPVGAPTARFTFSPTTVVANSPVQFDGSNSDPGTNATGIVSYSWIYGDGDTAVGVRPNPHRYAIAATYNVTLTVTNDRGLSASTTQPVTVAAGTAPTAVIDFSPTAPVSGQSIVFNGIRSTAAAGHTITSYSWDFGDGNTGSGATVTKAYTVGVATTFKVILTVVDDVGQRNSAVTSVTVTP